MTREREGLGMTREREGLGMTREREGLGMTRKRRRARDDRQSEGLRMTGS
jgi:hypothetical protein